MEHTHIKWNIVLVWSGLSISVQDITVLFSVFLYTVCDNAWWMDSSKAEEGFS